MTEDVLQYAWKVQAIKKNDLRTTDGSTISILSQGVHNSDEGPDFSSARVILDNVEWIGDVEIHVKGSDWFSHNHHGDKNYNKVILHAVWENDKPALREDDSVVPTLDLSKLIDPAWLDHYQELMASMQAIPCHHWLGRVDDVIVYDAFYKTLAERLEGKAERVTKLLHHYKGDWETVALVHMIREFGFKKNAEAFEHLAQLVDLKILRKLNSQSQMEAYFFGLAGLIPVKSSEDYAMRLQDEYDWIKNKFRLDNRVMDSGWWKFMRMRPANFPTMRIAQMASVLHNTHSFFRSVIEKDTHEIVGLFNYDVSEFWQNHYHFRKTSEGRSGQIGAQSSRVLCINVVAPLLVAYGQAVSDSLFIDKAVNLLESLEKENNAITRLWSSQGKKIRNAAESQGSIELFNKYCKEKNCLKCSIGNKILSS